MARTTLKPSRYTLEAEYLSADQIKQAMSSMFRGVAVRLSALRAIEREWLYEGSVEVPHALPLNMDQVET